MIRFRYLAFLSVLIVSVASAQDQDIEQQFDRTADNIERMVDGIVDGIETHIDRMFDDQRQDRDFFDEDDQDPVREEFRSKHSDDAVTFNGNTEITEQDTVHGDLVVKNGTLVVRGTVTGDVLVVNGDIELMSTARIWGNVRAMNGGITKNSGAFIEGFTEQSTDTPSRKYRRKYTQRAKYSYSFKPYFLNTEDVFGDNFLLRYNRVEGLFIGIGSEKKFYWDGSKVISGFGSFGYGFVSHKWRLQLGLDRQFAFSDESLLEIGGEVHSLTDTKDEWIIPLSENNLSAFFFHDDFRDYYQREGFSVHTAHYTKTGTVASMIDLRYLNDRYTSLATVAQWAMFGNRTFRSNPAVTEGTMKSVSLSAGVSTVEKYRYHSEGWNLFVKGEYGGKQFGGDVAFSQAIIDLRRFQPLGDDDQVNIRLRAGGLEGTMTPQKDFQLGGVNTMPAYGYKEFSGNRMFLANVEYRLSGEVIDEVFFFPNSMSLIAFGDVGAVTTVNTSWALYEGFDAFASSEYKTDYGVALAWHDGDARLGFAWRGDQQSPVSIFFRLNRAF